MKKYFPAILLTLCFLMICCNSLPAAEPATWSIKWNSDNSLDETIVLSDHNVVIEDREWNTSHEGKNLILSRHINNWQEYSTLGDGLPLQLTQKDYWLIKISSLAMKENAAPDSLFEQFAEVNEANISIEVAGIIRESSAEEEVDSTAVWNLNTAEKITLNAVVFDGMMVGIVFFGLCFIIIFIVYLARIKRVNQLITEEYSLARAAEEFARGENEIDEEENNK